jgi:hypothetical protein
VLYYYYFITAGVVVERKPCVRGKMSENAMRRSKATACVYYSWMNRKGWPEVVSER